MSQSKSIPDSSDEIEQLRAQLLRSEARLAQAQNLGKFGYWERDLAGDRPWWSDEFRNIMGLPPGATAVKFPGALESVHPDDRHSVERAYTKMVDSGQPFDLECRIVRPEGTERIIVARGEAIVGPDGAVTRVMGTVQDITERKQLEHALFESEARCGRIVDSVPLGIVVVDRDGRFLRTNPAWARVTGYSTEDLLQMNSLDLVHPDYRADVLRVGESSNGRKLDEFAVDRRYVRRNGEVFWARTVGATLRDEQGAVTGRVAIIEDISEEKEAEVRHTEHRRLQRDALVREVHHRIKNHLQGVAGLLERQSAANPALEPAIGEVLGQLNVLATMHGLQSDVSGRDVNLCSIARGIVDTAQAISTIPLEFALPAGFAPVEINVDETVPIALILNELVANAVKHLAPRAKQATVKIEIKREGACAVIVVRNQPASLPPGFDFSDNQFLGTGLRLVRSLLPVDGARLSFSQPAAGVVESTLELCPPVLNHAADTVSEASRR